eukprot:s990_g6.t1
MTAAMMQKKEQHVCFGYDLALVGDDGDDNVVVADDGDDDDDYVGADDADESHGNAEEDDRSVIELGLATATTPKTTRT